MSISRDTDFNKAEVFKDAARPKLKLFLSADIVGSTAYKQPLDLDPEVRKSSDWSKNIQRFYQRFAKGFVSSWDLLMFEVGERYGKDDSMAQQWDEFARDQFFGSQPKVWKTVGDEIIFWKELTSEDQIWFVLKAWMYAIARNREWLLDEGLDIKATCWVAGFPARNRVIVNAGAFESLAASAEQLEQGLIEIYGATNGRFISDRWVEEPELRNALIINLLYKEPAKKRPYGLEVSPYVDFLGSGIDTGFRLSSFSSSRRMAISADVAYLMSRSFETGKIETILPQLGEDPVTISYPDPDIDPEEAEAKREAAIGWACNPFSCNWPPKFGKHFGKLGLYYSGTHALKGVYGGSEYPFFWLNVEHPESLDSMKTQINRDVLMPRSFEDIMHFCERLFEDRKMFTFAPFIRPKVHDGADRRAALTTTQEPVDYSERLKRAHEAMGLSPAA